MEPKVLINIPVCFQDKYLKEIQDGLDTWVPLIKYPVIYSVSNPSIDSEYILVGNQLHCKCSDELNLNFSLKRFYFIKWAFETQEFDYLYIVGSDTFVHPYRFRHLIKDYFTNYPDVDYIGEVYPRDGSTLDFTVNTHHYIEDWRIFTPVSNNWLPEEDYEWKNKEYYPHAAGGGGYILSKRSANILIDNFNYLIDYSKSLKPSEWADDFILAQVLRNKANIILHHDSRINHFSPSAWDSWRVHPERPIPIEDSDFVVAQHYRSLEFKSIMEKLNL